MSLLLAAFALGAAPLPAGTADFVPLFNGRDLTGWTATAKPAPNAAPVDPLKTWSAGGGVLRCTGRPNGYLATVKEYGDYVLKVSYRFPADAKAPNSGILLHVTGPDRYWPHSIEAQMKAGFVGDVWLNADDKGVLPVVDIPKSQFDAENPQMRHYFRPDREAKAERPPGEWNEYVVTSQGGAFTLSVNGQTVNAAKGGSLKKGRIGLQSEGSPVEFRDIVIKAMK